MQPKPTGWQTVQPYKLLPRQEQRQDLTASPNGTIIGRPLTDFLFEQRSPALNNGILLPPPYERPIYSD
jgi:hypothetical protein